MMETKHSAEFLYNLLLKLILKEPNNIAADDILILYFYLSKKIRLDFSCVAEDSLETSNLIFSEKQ